MECFPRPDKLLPQKRKGPFRRESLVRVEVASDNGHDSCALPRVSPLHFGNVGKQLACSLLALRNVCCGFTSIALIRADVDLAVLHIVTPSNIMERKSFG